MSNTTSPTHGRVADDNKAGKLFGRLQAAHRARTMDGSSQYHESVNVAKPRKVNAARCDREGAPGCFCEVAKGGRQEPVAV